MASLLNHLLLSVDPSIGRIDKHSVSQQTIMELFVATITTRNAIWGPKENPKEITKWKNLVLDSSNDVTEIRWYGNMLYGSIDLQWLPFSARKVYLSDNFLSESIDLTCLPDNLEVLDLGNNRFEGTVDLTRLPPNIKSLYLDRNTWLSGKTDFSQLPKSLKDLNVSKTQLEGEVCAFDGRFVATGSYVKYQR